MSHINDINIYYLKVLKEFHDPEKQFGIVIDNTNEVYIIKDNYDLVSSGIYYKKDKTEKDLIKCELLESFNPLFYKYNYNLEIYRGSYKGIQKKLKKLGYYISLENIKQHGRKISNKNCEYTLKDFYHIYQYIIISNNVKLLLD